MVTVVALHEVDDVAHWLNSPKRAEFFGTLGMAVRDFIGSISSVWGTVNTVKSVLTNLGVFPSADQVSQMRTLID